MDEIGEHAWIISIVGNFLTLFGAYWTARAILLAPEQAAEIAAGRWDNEPLKNALLKQSNDARAGLVCVAVGAGFQIVSKLIQEFFSRASFREHGLSDDGETNSARVRLAPGAGCGRRGRGLLWRKNHNNSVTAQRCWRHLLA